MNIFIFLPKTIKNVSGYVCNHGYPNGERDTASSRGRYRERPQLSMCGLTTEWILESAQSLACALTITWILEERSMPWSGELLIPRSERELRRSEGSGKLIDDPLW